MTGASWSDSKIIIPECCLADAGLEDRASGVVLSLCLIVTADTLLAIACCDVCEATDTWDKKPCNVCKKVWFIATALGCALDFSKLLIVRFISRALPNSFELS